MRRNVVISGVGVVSGLGVGIGPLWDGLVSGRSALRPSTRVRGEGLRSGLSGEVPELSAKDALPKSYRKAIKVMARDIELAVVAARAALDDGGVRTRNGAPEADGSAPEGSTYPNSRMGCHVGAGLISAEAEELTAALATARDGEGRFSLRAWGTASGADGEMGRGGMNNLPPLWMLKYLPNMLACHVTILHGAEGPSNTITCAEASGLLSVGESVRVIQRGAADLCFTGGAESKLNLMGVMRMQMAGRLAETGAETDGSKIVRPFDSGSPGGVAGEAGGILLVEEESLARARGAKVYAQVAGVGSSQSGRLEHEPAGDGADQSIQDAIEAALEDAGADAADIDAIVPHGTGVWALDRGEAGALRAVFGDRLASIEMITLSPNIGECMAGNGGVMCAAGAMAISTQTLPSRIHTGRPMDGVRAGATGARAAKLRQILVCTSSLGGQSAAVVLRAV